MSASRTPAETYEAFMVPFRFRPWAGELLDRARLSSGMRLLDIACGTGIVARVANERMKGTIAAVGIDMNPAMIEVATRTACEENSSIEWRVGNVESLPFPDRSFDLVTIQQGLQFFPDQPAALRECFRVLAPGGTLLSASGRPWKNRGFSRPTAEAIERVTGTPSMHAPYGTVTEKSLAAARRRRLHRHFDRGSHDRAHFRRPVHFHEPNGREHVGRGSDHARPFGRRASRPRGSCCPQTAEAVRASTSGGRLRTHSTAFLAIGTRPQ